MSRDLVLQKIQEACERAKRSRGEVRLLAVSKKQPLEKIESLLQQGQNDFGENYVQELLTKKSQLPNAAAIRWHLIGHLQKNKIKYILGQCDLIHSVDSLSLAHALSKKLAETNQTQRILLQVNLSGEASKEGFSKEDLMRDLPQLVRLPQLIFDGLMTMPPLQNEAEENRPYFKQLRELRDQIRQTAPQHPWSELSMGTSHDFEVAVEEGATLVRVGTLIFGERPSR